MENHHAAMGAEVPALPDTLDDGGAHRDGTHPDLGEGRRSCL